MEFLTPNFQPDELTCKDAPRGQLPSDISLEGAIERVIGIDEAGEDCRQRLTRTRMKVEVFNEVVATINAGKKVKDPR